MGDEAIALGAIHSGLSAAFAYPGTPSTEIMEYYQDFVARGGDKAGGDSSPGRLVAQWCTNEKAAYESALGASFAGRRVTVSMKHVGLNVAADPFVNSALLKIKGGLVVIVADDPGMHSSQDEQDSRALAEFARIPCLEPADQQEAYDMTREAFDLSERFNIPVLIRITTRLAHSRSGVQTRDARKQNPVSKAEERWSWTLMPHAARSLWKVTIAKYEKLREESEGAATLEKGSSDVAVITTGLALEYYRENAEEFASALGKKPAHLHIGQYPMPYGAIRDLCAKAKEVLVIEEGAPFVERSLRGILPTNLVIKGKETGEVPLTGELTPDNIRPALGLAARKGQTLTGIEIPKRPPQLCQGCPHADSYAFLKEALEAYPAHSVNGDIGCYTLGAMPPFDAIESCVDMGASIGMARGAAEAGLVPAVAVIGDSTFYHSGLSNLIDAVSHNSNVTILILDNSTTGMTGAQPTILPSERLKAISVACGVDEGHVVVLSAHKNDHAANVAALRRELEYKGPSVVISARGCLEALKKARKA
jgi:indolepyruvate ferredoxin oxidoreductase alpha subunit